MAASSQGKVPKPKKASQVVKAQKKRKSTPSSRKHHFETFSQRIVKLKIDPIRRTRRPEDVQDEGEQTSYFGTSLEEWKDLNMSETFTCFYREVAPVAESLPMILHHETRIMDTLLRYIEKRDTHSLEPLLGLLAHFAHDLDVRFEKHFQRTVASVAQIAAKVEAPEAIEWSFTCLAWLFKYLSRLLVPDLRPLYDLMAPFLGQERQKPFVIRFAAEAMSFLVRKAGTMFEKKREPLETIVRHMVEDFGRHSVNDLYAQGLMALFTESIKGVQTSLHSGGNAVLRCLIGICWEQSHLDGSESSMQILRGSLISIIHHTDRDTFEPIMDTVLQATAVDLHAEIDMKYVVFANQLLFIIVATRMGTRISDWPAVLDRSVRLVAALDSVPSILDDSGATAVLNTLALVLQTAPLDAVLSKIAILDTLSTPKWVPYFLPFCYLFADLGQEKFRSLLFPHFQRFIQTHWEDQELDLCCALPRMSRNGLVRHTDLQCPPNWQKKMIKTMADIAQDSPTEISTDVLALCNANLAVLRSIQCTPDSLDDVRKRLVALITVALSPAHISTLLHDFALGKCLQVANRGHASPALGHSKVEALCHKADACKGLLPYWTGLYEALRTLEATEQKLEFSEHFTSIVIECLSAPSHELRLAALHILVELYRLRHSDVPDLLEVAKSIEFTPPTIQSSRFISSQIRRLALGYKDVQDDPILGRAIPTYCFGLLHVRLLQAWNDATQALKDMSAFQRADEVISTMTSSWLKGGDFPLDEAKQNSSNDNDAPTRVVSDFECSNVLQIEAKFQSAQNELANPGEKIAIDFQDDLVRVSLLTASNRTQALRALGAMPQLAEKRSRLLVPVLLEWAGEDAASSHTLGADDEVIQKWNRKDQKSMLDIFAQFHNPRVLYRSADVYRALLSLLSNGDTEIQKSALKAVLAWKTPEVNRYEERLLNLLDDARFREEVSVFLRLDEEEAIRLEDCASLMPVLLRLLYGKAVTRAGTASGVRGQQTRRKAIFGALARFPQGVLEQFIDVAIGSISSIELLRNGRLHAIAIDEYSMPARKQLGMLNMVGDLLECLGAELHPFAKKLANALLLPLLKVSKSPEPPSEANKDEDSHSNMDRSVRQAGMNGLVELFTSCPNLQWEEYARIVMEELVGPRLDKLPVETAQSVSSTLKIFSAWSSTVNTANFLVEFKAETMQKLADCLAVPSAKHEVKIFIIEQIVGKLLNHVDGNETRMQVDGASNERSVKSTILEPNARFFLIRIGDILRQNPQKELLDASVSCVSRLAPLIKEPEDMKSFIDVATSLLRQPTKRVVPTAKRDLLKTLLYLVPGAELKSDQNRFDQIYQALCPLFAFFRDRESRELMCQVLGELSKDREDLQEVTDLCTNLNSFSTTRLDEPDFERRSLAFDTINEEKYLTLEAHQWRPIVHNMLYYIRDNEELAIRTSASFSLRKFVEAASFQEGFKTPDFEDLVTSVLIPGLQHGMREQSELVRAEYLAVLAHLIKRFTTWSAVNDMYTLLANDDDEASFFSNILHIQQHRRMRALRRLATEAKTGAISSNNVSSIFIPLLEHFIFDPATDESAHNLTAEAVQSLSALLESLHWSQYRLTLKRFTSYIKSKTDVEKVVIRLVGATIDSLYSASQGLRSNSNSELTVPDGDATDTVLKTTGSQLHRSLPSTAKLTSDIIDQFLPPLTEYLHRKDESTVSLRVPVAFAVVKLLRVLPPGELAQRLPSVLMGLAHILRSRDQGARDMTRKTLADIAALLGPDYFRFIVKELKSALQRGYQLHVLSFTVHSILVTNSALLKPGDLDSCLPEIVSVIMDDIFGVTGQEKDAEEYISKMKEVKSSKSFDSMELVAKITTLPYLNELIRPIQTLLMEKLDLRTVKKIDELLRRVGMGTSHNAGVENRDILVFCYEIIQQVNEASAKIDAPRQRVDDYKTRKYLMQMQSASRAGNKGATSSYLFKLVRFAFDILRSVIQRHEELKTPANISGFLPVIGDSLVGGQDEVQLSAVRLLTSIVKVPAAKIERDAPAYAAEAINIIRAAPSTTTELAQAALKLVSAVFRERPSVKVKETDVAYVLKRLKPDLEEPDRQGVIFNFLRALLSRKIVITEVYEILDTVAGIMVTNQTRTARDLARGIYFQFIMEYPQGKDRLSKQVNFLVKNLEYQYVEGRQSVLELVHLLVNKTHGDLVQDLSSMLFVPLVMVMVNDESADCREMAGALTSKILEKSDEERRKTYMNLLRTWLEQDEHTLLRRVAIQCWTMSLEVGQASAEDITFILKQVSQLLPSEDKHIDIDDWELLYYALQAFAKISEKAPSTAFSASNKLVWTSIFRSLLFPHAWVKLSAARLVGALFADVASHSGKIEGGLAVLPLRSSGRLSLSEHELHGICNSTLRALKHTSVTEQLATQTARNLIFLGRCFAANGMAWKTPAQDKEGAQDGDGGASDGESADEGASAKQTRTALSFLFNRLSAILRREVVSLKSPALIPKTASLQVTAALANQLPSATLESSLQTILLPLHHLTDPSIPPPTSMDPAFTDGYKNLTTMAQEVMSLLQKKLGTTEYVKVMAKVQAAVRDRREGRRQKRRIEAVAAPEKWQKDKQRKYEGKKERRKEKGQEAMGRRRGW